MAGFLNKLFGGDNKRIAQLEKIANDVDALSTSIAALSDVTKDEE